MSCPVSIRAHNSPSENIKRARTHCTALLHRIEIQPNETHPARVKFYALNIFYLSCFESNIQVLMHLKTPCKRKLKANEGLKKRNSFPSPCTLTKH